MVLHPDIESYLTWYLPNVAFSPTSISNKKNPLCALTVRNSTVMCIQIPYLSVVGTEDLRNIIGNHLPQVAIDEKQTLGTPRFEFINFIYNQLMIFAYIRFFKNDPKPFNFDEFFAYQLENNIKLKTMLALLDTPELLVKSDINQIYYYKENKSGNIYPCISKLKIDATEYYNVGINVDIVNVNIGKIHNLKIIDWSKQMITLALI